MYINLPIGECVGMGFVSTSNPMLFWFLNPGKWVYIVIIPYVIIMEGNMLYCGQSGRCLLLLPAACLLSNLAASVAPRYAANNSKFRCNSGAAGERRNKGIGTKGVGYKGIKEEE